MDSAKELGFNFEILEVRKPDAVFELCSAC
jgi:hypothetical protein